MKFRTLKSALYDLDDIADWVTEHFGPSFAFDTESELFKTFERLADFPHIGVAKPEIDRPSVRFFLHRPYWISYSPGEPLLIRRVYHAARRPLLGRGLRRSPPAPAPPTAPETYI